MTRKKRERAFQEKQRRRLSAALPAVRYSLLEALPDPHAIIAALLPDGDKDQNRLRLSLASRTLYSLHGNTLTALRMRRGRRGSYRTEALAALVGRQQQRLKEVNVRRVAVPSLARILAQGCLGHITKLTVTMNSSGPTAMAHVERLAEALKAPGVLQALEHLAFTRTTRWQAGMVPLLASALRSGAAPSLRILDLGGVNIYQNEDLGALATMVKTRGQHHDCRGLERIKGGFGGCLFSAIAPLLCALLPSVTTLHFEWDADYYEHFFVELRPPHLKICDVTGPGIPSVEIWEAMPKLEELIYAGHKNNDGAPGHVASLEPFISALSRGVAFQELQELTLQPFELEDDEWTRLFSTLAGAHCASQLRRVIIWPSNLCPASLATLSDLIGKDTFPMFQALGLGHSPSIGDNGVEVLAKGLLAASRTRLTFLVLVDVGMGDKGLGALASAIRGGVLDQLGTFALDNNAALTDEGVGLLAQATKECGLPNLCKCYAANLPLVTRVGVQALAHAVINNGPRLTKLDLSDSGANEKGLQEAAEEMVRVADCRYRVKLVWAEEDEEE